MIPSLVIAANCKKFVDLTASNAPLIGAMKCRGLMHDSKCGHTSPQGCSSLRPVQLMFHVGQQSGSRCCFRFHSPKNLQWLASQGKGGKPAWHCWVCLVLHPTICTESGDMLGRVFKDSEGFLPHFGVFATANMLRELESLADCT